VEKRYMVMKNYLFCKENAFPGKNVFVAPKKASKYTSHTV
jgi:hypothetical protein